MSGRYNAVWNKILSQVEIRNPEIARGFYLNGITPANRGCITDNSSMYIKYGATFDPNIGFYSLNGIQLNEDDVLRCWQMSPKFMVSGNTYSYFAAKTNFPILRKQETLTYDISYMFTYGSSFTPELEVLTFKSNPLQSEITNILIASQITNTFRYCRKLKTIIGILDLSKLTSFLIPSRHFIYAMH